MLGRELVAAVTGICVFCPISRSLGLGFQCSLTNKTSWLSGGWKCGAFSSAVFKFYWGF